MKWLLLYSDGLCIKGFEVGLCSRKEKARGMKIAG